LVVNTESATIVRPPGKGKFGDPASGSPVEFLLDGVMFAPGTSSENHDRANSVDTDAALYVQGNTDTGVLPTDRIRVRDELYEVVGKPAIWAGFGTVIQIRRFTG
jgi:hypothetical protein